MSNNIIGVATAKPQVLASQQIANTETVLYTCPAETSVMLGTVSMANTTGSAVVVQLSLVMAESTGSAANRVCYVSLSAHDSTPVPELSDQFLGPGDSISGIADTGSAVSIGFSGVVFS